MSMRRSVMGRRPPSPSAGAALGALALAAVLVSGCTTTETETVAYAVGVGDFLVDGATIYSTARQAGRVCSVALEAL